MTSYSIWNSPGVAQAEAEAVGAAVSQWLGGRGWTGPAVSFCVGYARARVRARHGTGSRLAVVLEMAAETESRIAAADQEHLRRHIDDVLAEVSAGAVAAHRLRIAALARAAAIEMLAEEMPEVSSAPLVWVGVAAAALVLGCSASEVALGDPTAFAARREVDWFAANQGGWGESRYVEWLGEGKRWRELVTRVEMMLVVEGIEAIGAVA